MKLDIRYTDEQLETIREQGFIYTCSCPSQVSEQIAHLRCLFAYQRDCIERNESPLHDETHNIIAKATKQAHDIMQQCLNEVLTNEKWNAETLEMPENIRKSLVKSSRFSN